MLLVRKDSVRQWTHVLHQLRRFWANGTYFPRTKWTPIRDVVFSALAEWRSVLSRASVFSLVAQLALGKLDITFTSFTWLRRVMIDSIFRCSVRHFSASSSELRPVVSSQSTCQKRQRQR